MELANGRRDRVWSWLVKGGERVWSWLIKRGDRVWIWLINGGDRVWGVELAGERRR